MNIKTYGIYFFTYITICIILYNLGLKKQILTLTLLSSFYIYYKKYYTSLPEFFQESNKAINQITNLSNIDNTADIKLDKSINNNQISNIITKEPILAKLNIIKNEAIEFINTHTITTNLFIENAQIIQENTKKIESSINNYYTICDTIFNNNNFFAKNEINNYYQQLQKFEKEIYVTIHNIIFINHKACDNINQFISYLKNEFKEISDTIVGRINKEIDILPTSNEMKESNFYNENNVLF